MCVYVFMCIYIYIYITLYMASEPFRKHFARKKWLSSKEKGLFGKVLICPFTSCSVMPGVRRRPRHLLPGSK